MPSFDKKWLGYEGLQRLWDMVNQLFVRKDG